jgi:mono/diheme cytochrome c family protein
MTGRRLILVAAAVVALAGVAAAAEPAELYERYCSGCHGIGGDGRGPAADMLIVKPRDFTKGTFKFRTTPAGRLPTDDDLFRTITRGINRTSMPGWSLLPERERWALVDVVKAFYPKWDAQPAATPVDVPPTPSGLTDAARVARGAAVYELLECGTCHGASGRGDGPSAAKLPPDTWGNPQKPFNFTKGKLKSGGAPADVYRTFMTGLNGTAMPSYYDILSEPDGEYVFDGDGWALVAYVLSLRESGAPPAEGR